MEKIEVSKPIHENNSHDGKMIHVLLTYDNTVYILTKTHCNDYQLRVESSFTLLAPVYSCSDWWGKGLSLRKAVRVAKELILCHDKVSKIIC